MKRYLWICWENDKFYNSSLQRINEINKAPDGCSIGGNSLCIKKCVARISMKIHSRRVRRLGEAARGKRRGGFRATASVRCQRVKRCYDSSPTRSSSSEVEVNLPPRRLTRARVLPSFCEPFVAPLCADLEIRSKSRYLSFRQDHEMVRMIN